jgi:hypothetical protein
MSAEAGNSLGSTDGLPTELRLVRGSIVFIVRRRCRQAEPGDPPDGA